MCTPIPPSPGGRSQSINPWQEGHLDAWDDRIPSLQASAAANAVGARADSSMAPQRGLRGGIVSRTLG